MMEVCRSLSRFTAGAVLSFHYLELFLWGIPDLDDKIVHGIGGFNLIHQFSVRVSTAARARRRVLPVLAALAAAGAMLGCQSGGHRSAADADRVTQGESDAPPQELITSRIIAPGADPGEGGVFDLARDVLREEGFILDRVDAAAGVITT